MSITMDGDRIRGGWDDAAPAPKAKAKKAKKRQRGRTYLLDQLPDYPWLPAQVLAKRDGRTLRWVILTLLAGYVKRGKV